MISKSELQLYSHLLLLLLCLLLLLLLLGLLLDGLGDVGVQVEALTGGHGPVVAPRAVLKALY